MVPDCTEDAAERGFQHRFTAELITSRADEIASSAAAALVGSDPDLAARWAPLARERWTDCLRSRLHDLAAALAAQSPEVFTAQTEWSRVAFSARGTPVEDLRAALETLRRIVTREVAPDDAALVDGYLAAALGTFDAPGSHAAPPQRLSIASRHGRLGAEYLLKILEGDRLAAARVIHDAVRNGLGVREAYIEVLLPVQQELGRLWHLNEISVAEEHFATSTTMMVMSQILPLADLAPRNGRSMIAACVEGNVHELGARMVADFFEMAGWRSLHLGPSMPVEDLVAAARDFKVDVVALSVALASQIGSLERTIGMLRHHLGAACPKILVGGAGLAATQGCGREIWRTLGADAYAPGAERSVEAACAALGLAPQ